MLTIALALTSCFNDDDEREDKRSRETSIVAFSLQEIKVPLDTVTKAGKDTTVIAKYRKINKHRFYIDHNNGTIYNPDSLPYGARVKAVIANIVTKSGGTLYFKSLTDDNQTPYAQKDSIDFSQPRTVFVYSQNQNFRRTYTITVNVHKQRGDEFTWKAFNDNADFALFENAKMVTHDKKIYVFGKKGSQTLGYFTSEEDGNTWTQLPATFAAEAYKSVIVNQGAIYLLDNGQIKRTTDGKTWETTGTASLQQLVAASKTELYALSDSKTLMVSKDNGANWTTETLDTDAAKLPTESVGYMCRPLAANSQIDRVVLFGTNTTSNHAIMWSKLVDYSNTATNHKWSFVKSEASETFLLPKYNFLTVLYYNNKAMAFGVTSDGKFAQVKESSNSGVVWTTNKAYVYPAATPSGYFAATADSKNYIWIVSGSKVWKGRINSMGWEKPQTDFTE
ncbi:hypothetical protein JCM15124A_10260 [Prevotella falsenii]